MEKATPFYSTADWEGLPRCWHCISIQSFHAGLELHSGHTEAEESPWWNSPEQEFFLTAVLALTHTPLSSIPGQRHTGCFYVPVTPKVTVWHCCAMVFLCFSSPWACESPCGCLELLQTPKDAQLPWLCTFLPLWEALLLPEAAAPAGWGTRGHPSSPASPPPAPALLQIPTWGANSLPANTSLGTTGPCLQCHSPIISFSWRSALLNSHTATHRQNT